jgi:uncharacterized protein YoaH (UPF0181 family)
LQLKSSKSKANARASEQIPQQAASKGKSSQIATQLVALSMRLLKNHEHRTNSVAIV